jgi:hypothetical protein
MIDSLSVPLASSSRKHCYLIGIIHVALVDMIDRWPVSGEHNLAEPFCDFPRPADILDRNAAMYRFCHLALELVNNSRPAEDRRLARGLHRPNSRYCRHSVSSRQFWSRQ